MKKLVNLLIGLACLVVVGQAQALNHLKLTIIEDFPGKNIVERSPFSNESLWTMRSNGVTDALDENQPIYPWIMRDRGVESGQSPLIKVKLADRAL